MRMDRIRESSDYSWEVLQFVRITNDYSWEGWESVDKSSPKYLCFDKLPTKSNETHWVFHTWSADVLVFARVTFWKRAPSQLECSLSYGCWKKYQHDTDGSPIIASQIQLVGVDFNPVLYFCDLEQKWRRNGKTHGGFVAATWPQHTYSTCDFVGAGWAWIRRSRQ